jgi:hypothetical protein
MLSLLSLKVVVKFVRSCNFTKKLYKLAAYVRSWVHLKSIFRNCGFNWQKVWSSSCEIFPEFSDYIFNILVYISLFWKIKVALWSHLDTRMSVCLYVHSPSRLFNAWTSLYETWNLRHGSWAHLNGVLNESLPSVTSTLQTHKFQRTDLTSLHETWYLYNAMWSYLNGVLRKLSTTSIISITASQIVAVIIAILRPRHSSGG